jgi:hypothetical protein
MQWQPIETAPLNERIVLAYFGPVLAMRGFACIGHFFKWEAMKDRLATGWPSSCTPTHWMPLPPPPGADA